MNRPYRHACVLLMGLAGLGTATPLLAAEPGIVDKLLGRTASEPLPPEQAFQVSARRIDANRISVDFSVRPGYYLYKDRTMVALRDTHGRRIASVQYPPATIKDDKTFGPSPVFFAPFGVSVTLDGPGKGPVKLYARYQGCMEKIGLCYPPQSADLQVD